MNDPRIGILIPAYNEELVLKGTIDALLAADCDAMDIYVVDDRSTDETYEVANECGVNIYTVPRNGGKAKAQVAALAHFQLLERYDWLIFLDGDTKVDPYFYNRMYEAANEDPSVALYVGQVKSVKNDHLYSAYRAYEYTFGHDLGKHAQSNFNVVYVSPGCASMYRTNVLAKLTIDPSTLAEDMDLTMQVHRLCERVTYVPEACVMTQDPRTLSDYIKQVQRWSRGFWQVVLKHNVVWIGPKSWVDAYMWMTMIDAIVFNRVFWLAGLVMLFPNIWGVLLLDMGIAFGISCYCGWRARRWDTVYKMPIYYWLSFLNLYLFMKTFVEIIVLRKEILAWNKVKRYDFSSNTAA